MEQINLEAISQQTELWAKASGHANILPIIEANIYDGQVVIVSEYAPDGSLELKLREKISVKQAVEILIGVLNGLDFLHTRQILHRNIKPANILFQGKTPRLAGFSLSQVINTTSTDTDIVGTFPYMAPEVPYGKYSFRTDIWAVGIILYEMLSGSLPFPQLALNDLIRAIMTEDPAPLPASVPLDLQRIISKALAKLPENRYQSAKEMGEDLQQVDFETIRQKAELLEQAVGRPNLSPINDANVDNRQVIIAGGYAETVSLFDKLKVQGKFSVEEAVETTIEILNGLDFLHHKQIIHCDIQPQNVIFQNGTPRLIGFEYLGLISGDPDELPISKTILYMSPEAPNGEWTVQTNIWSVGVILYQLLSGDLPFPRSRENVTDIYFAILTIDFAPLSDEIPIGLKDIVSKALSKKTQNRYLSAKEMREDLENGFAKGAGDSGRTENCYPA